MTSQANWYSLVLQWRWRVDASAWAILEKATLVMCWCITRKRQVPSKHYRFYIFYSHHHYDLLIQSANQQPKIYFSLLVDFVFRLPSCKHFSRFAFIRFHSTVNSLVLITNGRIRSGRGQRLLSEIPQSNTCNVIPFILRWIRHWLCSFLIQFWSSTIRFMVELHNSNYGTPYP